MVAQNHDVFISYAHSDMTFARKVRMELERNCIKWYEEKQKRYNIYPKREKKEEQTKVREGITKIFLCSWMDDQRLEAGSDWRADIGNGILAARLIGMIYSPFTFDLVPLLIILLIFSFFLLSFFCTLSCSHSYLSVSGKSYIDCE